MKCYFKFCLLGCFLACHGNNSRPAQQILVSIEALWLQYPDRIRQLINALDLNQSNLQPMTGLLEKGDTLGACQFLLDHFRQVKRDWVISTLERVPASEAYITANLLVNDSINLLGQKEKIPINPDGTWQWNFTGREPDDEYGYSLNGHTYLPSLFFAREASKQSHELTTTFDRIIKDWIIQHPLPSPNDEIYLVLDPAKSLDWRDIGEVEWRTLETGNRLGASWCGLFFAMQGDHDFSPATRLLMLSSILDQAWYLRRYHKSKHNWTTMEMNGLALTGLAFPEFREAPEWANYAQNVMENEIERQVYPDGVQTEISTKTQWVALHRFESVASHFEMAGKPLPDHYEQRLIAMYHYLAYCMRPDGHQPINNDSDREDLRPRVLLAAKKYNRPDWTWIATNGIEGILPEKGPSLVFPWGGIHIMRSGWEAQAHWSFFDLGPYGTGHQHRDKLHISIAAYGSDLLVDGGRFTHQDYFSFDPAIWRGYFRSSHSHNVILIDGHGQKAGPILNDQPLESGVDYYEQPHFVYAHGSFTDGFEGVPGTINQYRSVLYLKNQYWLIVDRLETDGLHQAQVLWHFAPHCEVKLEGMESMTINQTQANLQIIPLGKQDWQAEIIKGQSEPYIQGWYSSEYGFKQPNATLQYTGNIDHSATFAWLMIPSSGPAPEIKARVTRHGQILHFEVTNQDIFVHAIQLPKNGDPLKVNVIIR